jgi:hypothetical protein
MCDQIKFQFVTSSYLSFDLLFGMVVIFCFDASFMAVA